MTRASSHTAGHAATRSKKTAPNARIARTISGAIRPLDCSGSRRVGAAERSGPPVGMKGEDIPPEMTDRVVARANQPGGIGVIPHPAPDGVVRLVPDP